MPLRATRNPPRSWRHGHSRSPYALFLTVVFFVPIPSAPQAFFKLHLRLIAEYRARQRNVGLRMQDVAVARRIVLRGNFLPSDLAKIQQDLIQGDARSGPAIKHFPGGILGFASTQR